jgi:hypothetical protein
MTCRGASTRLDDSIMIGTAVSCESLSATLLAMIAHYTTYTARAHKTHPKETRNRYRWAPLLHPSVCCCFTTDFFVDDARTGLFTDFYGHGKAYNGGRWKSRVTRVMDVEWNTHVEATCNPSGGSKVNFDRRIPRCRATSISICERCILSVCFKLETIDALYSLGIMSRSLSKA